MLGKALSRQLLNKHEIIGLDNGKTQDLGAKARKFIHCDITDREKTISEIVSNRPDVIIHAAAYADVDGCERNAGLAQKVNAQGTENVALAAKDCGSFLCYISTDFVFDGNKDKGYAEEDKPNPINIYGRSKLEGEKRVQSELEKFAIIRSSWLFGPGGKNFVDTFLQKAQGKKKIEVVDDQFGSPTYTKDLALGIDKLMVLGDSSKGIYHITNSGTCSWFEFAVTIKAMAALDVEVLPVSSEQYDSPTKRPKMSVLENKRFCKSTGITLRHWKEALKEHLDERENFS